MNSLIKEKAEDLAKLCAEYRVRRLEIFGSAAEPKNAEGEINDLDFLVEFLPLPPGEHADAYFGLLESLQKLFHMPIDLVMADAVTNKYFLEGIGKNRNLLYAA